MFTAIGTTYGTGDGSTTFNVPNVKGKVPVGRDSGDTSFDTLGETGGEKTTKLTTTDYQFGTWRSEAGTSDDINTNVNSGTTYGFRTRYSSNNNTAHNNLQPYIVFNYIIKT